jgi:hypothetical protein
MIRQVLEDHPRSSKAHFVAAELYRNAGDKIAARFRERAMHDIMLHWPSTLSLPIMPSKAETPGKERVRATAQAKMKRAAQRQGQKPGAVRAHETKEPMQDS